ncbi:polyamine aminopropyltransferase [Verrucomicrobiaceae bacterium 227]
MKEASAGLKGWILGLTIFVMGGCGIAYEYSLSKVSSDLLGNSVQQWAVVIAVMLFFMGVGAEIQQRLPDRWMVDTLAGSQILLALLGGFGPLFLIQTFAYFPLHFSLVHYGLISICGLLIGLEIPLITRLNEALMPEMRQNIGKVLRMDYAGALLGGLFWTFLLIPRFTITQTALILAIITLLGAFACLWIFRRQAQRPLLWTILLAGVMALTGFGFLKSGNWAFHAEQSLYRDQVIYAKTSPYQRIVLTESRSGNLRCYINGHLQFSEDDEFIYHELLTHPAMALNPRGERILILGGGDGLALREVLKYPSVKEVTLVDLDPVMTEMAATQKDVVRINQGALSDHRLTLKTIPAESSGETTEIAIPNGNERFLSESRKLPKVELVHQDASRYVAETQGKFDVVILDFPDPSSPGLAKLYGLSFYGQLHGILRENGIIIQQSTSPWHARDAFCCIGRTLEAAGFSVVPLHANVPSFGDWGWWLATPDSQRSPADLKQALADIQSFDIPTRYLTRDTLLAATVFSPQSLETSFNDITTLDDPAIFRHYLNAWKSPN